MPDNAWIAMTRAILDQTNGDNNFVIVAVRNGGNKGRLCDEQVRIDEQTNLYRDPNQGGGVAS